MVGRGPEISNFKSQISDEPALLGVLAQQFLLNGGGALFPVVVEARPVG